MFDLTGTVPSVTKYFFFFFLKIVNTKCNSAKFHLHPSHYAKRIRKENKANIYLGLVPEAL